jgi:hypothetical protein
MVEQVVVRVGVRIDESGGEREAMRVNDGLAAAGGQLADCRDAIALDANGHTSGW